MLKLNTMNTLETIKQLNEIAINLLDVMIKAIDNHQQELWIDLENVYKKISKLEDDTFNNLSM